MKSNILKIATRKSLLALWQSEFIKQEILKVQPELSIELLEFTTKGDKLLDSPLAKIGGKGLFVKELETAILQDEADLAVHSLKDVPMQLPEGLELACILARHSPFDAFVSNKFNCIEEMPKSAIVGTSSLRRATQLQKKYPDLKFINLRGNIHTRLAKLDNGEYEAIILAVSGLERMGFNARIKQIFTSDVCLPACGQGALAIEVKSDNFALKNILAKLICQKTFIEVSAERAFNARLNGGCQVPIAGFAQILGNKLELRALVSSLDGKQVFCETLSKQLLTNFTNAENSVKNFDTNFAKNLAIAQALGKEVAEIMIAKGVEKVLQELGIASS